MLFRSLTLFSALTTLSSALPQIDKRQNVVYVTEQQTVTQSQVVTHEATAWVTAKGAQATLAATPETIEQIQVIVYQIAAQYTYSSARTVFAIPTTLTTTATQTALVAPYVTNGVTVTPVATTTMTNTLSANVSPSGTASQAAVIATLPLVSALISGATVTVPAQTFTYYTAVVPTVSPATTTADNAGNVFTAATTMATVVASATTASPVATGTSAASTQQSFISTVLNSMNAYRAQHKAPALTWDTSLAAGALAYAQSCVMQPTTDASFGETLAAGTATDPTFYIDLWYAENTSYNYNVPGFSDSTGHYTQLVWAATTSVGCGLASGCGEYSNYLVCRYSAAGNVVGGTDNVQFFIQNVQD